MSSSVEEFIKKAREYVRNFEAWAREYELTDKITADHFGYKCSSAEEFERLRKLFEEYSDYIYQSIISKRRIDIIKLAFPLETNCGHLWFLELSDQKPDGSQKSGFDHLEFFPIKNSVADLVRYLKDKNVVVVKVERTHHTTYDIALSNNFKVRIETESLIKKIGREEMGIF